MDGKCSDCNGTGRGGRNASMWSNSCKTCGGTGRQKSGGFFSGSRGDDAKDDYVDVLFGVKKGRLD